MVATSARQNVTLVNNTKTAGEKVFFCREPVYLSVFKLKNYIMRKLLLPLLMLAVHLLYSFIKKPSIQRSAHDASLNLAGNGPCKGHSMVKFT